MSAAAAAPTNAVLANAVQAKDLQTEKKHLEHVALDKAPVTQAGGVHVGPGKHADFPPNSLHTSSSTSAVGAVSKGGNQIVEASHSGEVSVQSTVSIDTTQKVEPAAAKQIQALLSRLSTTTTQIDEYSRRANEQISAEATRKVQAIIADTQAQQDLLLKDASARSLEIEAEYAAKLKAFLQDLDASKASNLASLEKDLNFRQEQLLSQARDNMDQIHREATAKKISVMESANRNVINDVDRLTDQVKQLGETEVERRLASTTTTVITTQTNTEASLADKTATQTVDKETTTLRAGETRSANVTRV